MSTIEIIQDIWGGFDFTYILSILLSVVPSLICITFHELSHGFVAYRLGDDTAKRAGRLSLNPLKHIDPMGLLMLAVFHFGWAKPVPINMYRFKNPRKGMAVTAIAGPVSNMILALIFVALYGALYQPLKGLQAGSYMLEMLSLGAYISTGLGIFNLIPIPPLDGSKVLFAAMSDEQYVKLMRYERYGMLLMVALVATGILGKPLSSVVSAVYRHVLLPVAVAVNQLVFNIFYR